MQVITVWLSCKSPSDVVQLITLCIHERALHQEVLRLVMKDSAAVTVQASPFAAERKAGLSRITSM